MKNIFGFCEDYDKVANTADPGKITLSKIAWFMPDVTPADKDKMELYKIIERKETLPVGYRMIQCTNASIPQTTSFSWRLSVISTPEVPRFIIAGFQTDKSGDQEENPSRFDNLNVRNIYAMLNSNRYPTLDYNLSFPAQECSRAYGDAAEFRSNFLNMNELISNPNFTPSEYKTLYPLFLFNVSKQSQKLKYSSTDIQIKMEFNENVPAGTQAFAVTISDRLINFQSDGNKFNVVIEDFFPYIKIMNIRELKTILKENKIHFCSYWDKKRLIALANEHDLLPKKALEKEKSKDPKYDRLKTIKQKPRKVSLEDIETGEIKSFPSIYKAGKFIDQVPMTVRYWECEVWNNKYKVAIQ